ncbi:MAG: hypothetical protein WAR79_13785 [Melioribacteraceae bacterium]
MINKNDVLNKTIEEKPPILSSWRKIYTIVFMNLVILVILFYLFTKYFS